ncbi:MAG: AIR carboxylase family protein [Clostridia bacterium]|nr:AIR carboxylase family protein [Clostridia bacterium]
MRRVGFVMGGNSDLSVLRKTMNSLSKSGIARKCHGFSARDNGFGVIIVSAGMAVHLAGAIAANTALPVLGIPCKSLHLDGIDALLSTVQMSSGIPAAAAAINGGVNAALLSA